MTWQEACRKSRRWTAVRVQLGQDGRVYRMMFRGADGRGEIQVLGYPDFREARPGELEGYDDWEPAA